MNNSNKDNNLKEKLRQALTSTFKVISDDLKLKDKTENNKSSKRFDFFDLENLNTKNDFIKARAESDSLALQKKFSNKEIYKFLKDTVITQELIEKLVSGIDFSQATDQDSQVLEEAILTLLRLFTIELKE